MEKAEIIKQLREKGIEFNPNAHHFSLAAQLKNANIMNPTSTTPQNTSSAPLAQSIPDDNSVLQLLNSVANTLKGLDERMGKLEGKQSTAYRSDVKQEDVDKADETKQNVDPKIVKIVEESLGTDFGVKVEGFDDKPGFLFTVIVPQRLSDKKEESRPIKDKETGQYKKDDEENTLFENYYPEDRRSRAIGSMQSYDAIKEHCDRVRSYIVSYYQKTHQPLPEFRVK